MQEDITNAINVNKYLSIMFCSCYKGYTDSAICALKKMRNWYVEEFLK